MRKLLFVAGVLLCSSSASAQPAITPSQTQLIGCFGEAFTLVEHVWRIAPRHLAQLAEQAKDAQSDARKQFLDGVGSAAVAADQDSALAVVRNLNGCLDQTSRVTAPDQTTAILATAVRAELDRAPEGVAHHIDMVRQQQDALRTALRTARCDGRGSALDVYLTFGDRMRDQWSALRRKVDAVVAA